jgi:hypothetical protein
MRLVAPGGSASASLLTLPRHVHLLEIEHGGLKFPMPAPDRTSCVIALGAEVPLRGNPAPAWFGVQVELRVARRLADAFIAARAERHDFTGLRSVSRTRCRVDVPVVGSAAEWTQAAGLQGLRLLVPIPGAAEGVLAITLLQIASAPGPGSQADGAPADGGSTTLNPAS